MVVVVAFSENTFNDRRGIDTSCTDTEQYNLIGSVPISIYLPTTSYLGRESDEEA